MSNTSNVSSEGNCSPFDTSPYVAVAVLSACSGGMSAIACLLVIAVILIFKKYLFFIQRLILYLSIAALLNSLSVVLRLQRIAQLHGDSDSLHGLCVFTAVIDQSAAWSELVAISCVTFSLLLNVVLLRSVEKLEWVYVLLIFTFPLLFNWIPFIKSSYGEAGAWCWIRNEDSDCHNFSFGNYLRFILWYIPLYVILFILLATYIVIICRVHRLRLQWEGKFDPEIKKKREQMRSEFRPLVWYPLIYIFLNIFPLLNRIHDGTNARPVLSLWILHAISDPLKGGFVALAYSLDSETVRRLCSSQSIRVIMRPNSTEQISEYPSAKAHSDSFGNEEASQKSNETPVTIQDSSGHLAIGMPGILSGGPCSSTHILPNVCHSPGGKGTGLSHLATTMNKAAVPEKMELDGLSAC